MNENAEVEQINNDQVILHQWSARNLRPVIIVYVAIVFLGFIAVAHVAVHSPAAVKALAIAAVGSIFPLVPVVLNKTEYRLTGSGLQKRRWKPDSKEAFKDVFDWDQLHYVVPCSVSFKYYKPMGATGGMRRIWNKYMSDSYSGEFHVEVQDREAILEILTRRKIPTRPK